MVDVRLLFQHLLGLRLLGTYNGVSNLAMDHD